MEEKISLKDVSLVIYVNGCDETAQASTEGNEELIIETQDVDELRDVIYNDDLREKISSENPLIITGYAHNVKNVKKPLNDTYVKVIIREIKDIKLYLFDDYYDGVHCVADVVS